MTMLDEDLVRDLLHRSTEGVDPRPDAAARVTARLARRHRRRVAAGAALSGAAAVAVISASVASPGSRPDVRAAAVRSGGAHDRAATPGRPAAPGRPGSATILYRLAAVSRKAPAAIGKYVVLSETDSQTGTPGASRRTSVIDTADGSSVTYQTEGPAALTEGPDPTNTAAWYAALPTDPTALRPVLLSMGEKQQAQSNAFAAKSTAAMASHGVHLGTPKQLDADELVYQQADEMLWNPLVAPTLRSTLYDVIAATPGVEVDPDATDPAGQASIAMSYSYADLAETDVTYEDPSTGAVLAQQWSNPSGDSSDPSTYTITAVYEPVTASSTLPPDPYTTAPSGQ